MTLTVKLTEKDFINVNFALLLRKPPIKILIGIYCIYILSSLVTVIASKTDILQLVISLVFMAIFPTLIYFSAKRNYTSNKRMSETVEYKFEKNALAITGESFNSQLSWDKIYMVTKTKKWLLIWQDRQIANVIPNRDLWPSHIDDLKEILAVHNVKNNL